MLGRKVLYLAVICVALAGCQSVSERQKISRQPVNLNEKLDEILILPAQPKVEVGKKIALSAKGFNGLGGEMAISPSWSISETDRAIGSLDKPNAQQVVFSGKKPGWAMVMAESQGVVSSVKVEVTKGAMKKNKSVKK